MPGDLENGTRDANGADNVTGDRAAPGDTPHDTGVDESTLSMDPPHVICYPQPVTDARAHQQRALRHMSRRRKLAPAWLNRFSWLNKSRWVLFATYGFMRFNDENYEEHYDQWRDHERKNYDQRKP
jgi:hypothetical protein